MTIFIIILAMFTASVVTTMAAKERKHQKFIQFHKTNSQLQYDTACNATETFGKRYRQAAANLTLDEYCPGQTVYLNKKCTTYGNYKDIIKGYDVSTIQISNNHHNHEMNWLITIALACGYSLEDNFMSKIYKEEIWENFPTQINNPTIRDWKMKYPNHIKKGLREHLTTALWLKEQIIKGHDIGSYEAYTNQKVINIVATHFGLPTTYELEVMRQISYKNLNNVIWAYTTKELKRQGYNSAPLREINPNPTDEQKARQYAGLSLWESQCLRRAEEFKLQSKNL